MAVLTTLAIIGGATLLIGGGAVAASWFATEDDRARARIAEIDQEIANCDTIIENFDYLKTKLSNGKSYLNSSKTDFKNGGHVLDGVPLANSEFKACITDINNAITSIDNIINRYTNEKAELNEERRQLQAKLD